MTGRTEAGRAETEWAETGRAETGRDEAGRDEAGRAEAWRAVTGRGERIGSAKEILRRCGNTFLVQDILSFRKRETDRRFPVGIFPVHICRVYAVVAVYLIIINAF